MQGESASEPPKQQNGRPGFAGFRAGMLDLLMESRVADTAAIAAVHRIKGNVSDTFKEVDESKDGFIDKAELGQLLAGLGATNDGGESADVDELLANIKEAAKDWDDTKPNQVSLGEFTDWYVTSENRIDADLQKAFERVDEDGNGVINRAEMEKVLKTMGNSPSPEELEQSWTELDADSDGDVNKEEFIKWCGPPPPPESSAAAFVLLVARLSLSLSLSLSLWVTLGPLASCAGTATRCTLSGGTTWMRVTRVRRRVCSSSTCHPAAAAR